MNRTYIDVYLKEIKPKKYIIGNQYNYDFKQDKAFLKYYDIDYNYKSKLFELISFYKKIKNNLRLFTNKYSILVIIFFANYKSFKINKSEHSDFSIYLYKDNLLIRVSDHHNHLNYRNEIVNKWLILALLKTTFFILIKN